MPFAVISKHTFTCNHCDWVKCGDKRTMKHAVALHAKLVHDVINELPDLIQKVRSEERRVGKECRSRVVQYYLENKTNKLRTQ